MGRPLQDEPGFKPVGKANSYEEAQRIVKASKLADAFWRHARTVLADAGRSTRKPTDARKVLALAQAASRRLWVDLAASEGIPAPSAATIRQAVAALATRARLQGTDPLDGLPQ